MNMNTNAEEDYQILEQIGPQTPTNKNEGIESQ